MRVEVPHHVCCGLMCQHHMSIVTLASQSKHYLNHIDIIYCLFYLYQGSLTLQMEICSECCLAKQINIMVCLGTSKAKLNFVSPNASIPQLHHPDH